MSAEIVADITACVEILQKNGENPRTLYLAPKYCDLYDTDIEFRYLVDALGLEILRKLP
jgi:hypothetical protein